LALRAEAEAEAALMPDLRGNEDRALESLLYDLGLGLVPIPADGHCLFRAVAEQLVRLKRQDEKLAAAAGGGGGGSAGEVGEVTARLAGVAVTGKAPQRGGLASGFFSHSTTEGTVTAVRGACADEISRSYDEISAFLMDEDGHIPSKEDYCNRLRNTAHWGGEPELKALSDTFRVPIVVYSVGSPARVIGEQYCPEGVSLENGAKATGAAGEDGVMLMDGVIRLTYHRHAFALGAHYNAVVPYNGHDFTLISK
jgi:OTU domain-containing protein 6